MLKCHKPAGIPAEDWRERKDTVIDGLIGLTCDEATQLVLDRQ